jgi:hypothetical protein
MVATIKDLPRAERPIEVRRIFPTVTFLHARHTQESAGCRTFAGVNLAGMQSTA